MAARKLGLVHTPVTPFTQNGRIDFAVYAQLIEFHLRNGADALALPMHAGESVSLTDEERQELLEFAVERVKKRVPVIAHVSQSGTSNVITLAVHAERAGATAILATTPYYWTPPQAMLLEHFSEIAAAVRIPYYVYNSPEEMGGTKVTTDVVLKLIEKHENFAGVVDASLDWQYMIELVSIARRARVDFEFLSAVEYMISAGAIGATGLFAPMAGIVPKLVYELFDLCRHERYAEARKPQEALAALHQVLNRGKVAALKAGMRAMGRECGAPRLPLDSLEGDAYETLATQLHAMNALHAEPRGW